MENADSSTLIDENMDVQKMPQNNEEMDITTLIENGILSSELGSSLHQTSGNDEQNKMTGKEKNKFLSLKKKRQHIYLANRIVKMQMTPFFYTSLFFILRLKFTFKINLFR